MQSLLRLAQRGYSFLKRLYTRQNSVEQTSNCNSEEQIHALNPIVIRLLKKRELKFLGIVQKITLLFVTKNQLGHAVTQWLRHCATKRKVVKSIPDYVIGIFH
jgi:uncharacterized protein YqiB (DUF1249 family)